MNAKLFATTIAVWLMLCGTSCTCRTLESVYTSTRSVTGIVVTSDGTIIAGTRGGVLTRTEKGVWRKYTVLDGLPSNEVLGVYQQDDRAIAITGKGYAQFRDGGWVVDPDVKTQAKHPEGEICSTRWKGLDCVSTAEGLRIRTDGTLKSIPMPRSTGTHISALLDRGNALWAAMFGDGVFAWDGKTWNPVKLDLPEHARGITTMASVGEQLWVGTSHDGIWKLTGNRWTQHLYPDEPLDHNIQELTWYQGNLYASTLDNGLMVYTPKGWQHIGTPQISTNTPRQMVLLDNFLYVRQSTGEVDKFDGKTWTRNALGSLPRKQCSALATDGERLYVGQWGGWSELVNRAWTHHLNIPEMQGFQVTALLPEHGSLWVGTQGLGLAQINRSDDSVKWHNEVRGMPDDTVKCLARSTDTMYAGTFSQGMAWMKDESDHWEMANEISGAQVTCLESDGAGGVYIGARTGLWQFTSEKQMVSIMPGVEVQALQLLDTNLWVGTRTGLLRFAANETSLK